ncbi:MAG: hypothetical protein UU16_C0021G0009 [Candidatus Woesebacteria bacterium GW2011_GWA2_40_7]|uniref:Uncharacterized protein n=3 Tax=Candidatus Woeseibacteriota TaxID=1752722 RepID=A0A0G1FV71_9BACT|nr:MAG: hypothetical protein UU16_C0021G0009 [Candidatus Woesebacteria bacterium GW2011_GWA2_40_7]KKS90663.1 MAG: hypothetical protein UV66_C0001G0020 [Candidatus Woesebacteria bacterium GW2011_GWA1_43_12]
MNYYPNTVNFNRFQKEICMNTKVRSSIVLLSLLLALAFGQVGTAAAAGCSISASTINPKAGEFVHFTVETGLDVTPSIYFSDSPDPTTPDRDNHFGRSFPYNMVPFTVTAVIVSPNNGLTKCHIQITVQATAAEVAPITSTTPTAVVPTATATAPAVTETPATEQLFVVDEGAGDSSSVTSLGDNNGSQVSGNGNIVTYNVTNILPTPAPTQVALTPVVIENKVIVVVKNPQPRPQVSFWIRFINYWRNIFMALFGVPMAPVPAN